MSTGALAAEFGRFGWCFMQHQLLLVCSPSRNLKQQSQENVALRTLCLSRTHTQVRITPRPPHYAQTTISPHCLAWASRRLIAVERGDGKLKCYTTFRSIVSYYSAMPKQKRRPVAKFQHSRLRSPRSIRLLNLHPSSDLSAPLDVSLFEASLDDFPSDRFSYEALSYVWGALTGSIRCTCDGKRLLITPNCNDALRHLRLSNRHRILWGEFKRT
jgi:hypothetical protein